MLHLVFTGSSAIDLLTRCLAALGAGDAVLMLDDGVAELVAQPTLMKELETLTEKGCRFMILDEQAKAIRSALPAWLEVVSYKEFVQLATEHEQSRSWF